MKKVFLLIAMAAFVFACGNTVKQEECVEKAEHECADYEGKICCKDGKPCEGKENCKKECEKKCEGKNETKKECEKKCEGEKKCDKKEVKQEKEVANANVTVEQSATAAGGSKRGATKAEKEAANATVEQPAAAIGR
ncbi:MAG: hypothetical protein FWE63_04855 [Bacteroidales bacterium]|nr:hypothetical protein [Bacteroidales bacterium]